MSNTIFYKRAYIRVDEYLIPIVSQGSDQDFIKSHGRILPSTTWQTQNYLDCSKLIFTDSDLLDTAEDLEYLNQESRYIFKANHKLFLQGELKRWIMSGRNSAHTIEEYVSCGNSVSILDYTSSKYKEYQIHTTVGFWIRYQDLLTKHATHLNVTFGARNIIMPPTTSSKQRKIKMSPQYFVLANEKGYFCKRGAKKIWVSETLAPVVRAFATWKEADSYRLLLPWEWRVEAVSNMNM